MFCLAGAWALRRPAGAPLWAIVALGLAADLALDRPVGLGALALVAAAEALRASAAALRSGPFVGEWLTVAGLALAWALSAHAAMQLVFLDGPGLPALLREAAATALAYPLVVLVLAWGVGMRRGPAAPARPRPPAVRPPAAPPPRITRRGLMLLGIQLGTVGALAARMRQLQIVDNERYALLAEENRVNIRLIPPARGLIYDREGRALAVNRQNYRIVMVREQAARDPEAILDRLGRIVVLAPELASGR